MKKFSKYVFNQITLIMVMFYMFLCITVLAVPMLPVDAIWICFLVSAIITLVVVIYTYKKNCDYFEQLYIKVFMEYKIRDEYKNYMEIKNLILNYSYNGGDININQNICVIKAGLERDKASSLLYSAIVTIIGVLIGIIPGEGTMFKLFGVIFFLLVFMVYLEVSRKLPRGSFIKKILEDIQDDIKNV